jgi:hypothetical protein
MIKGISAVCLSLVGLVSGYAQDKEDPQQVLEKALVIQIEAKVTDRNSKAVLSFSAAKVAISGEPFPVTLDGRSIRGTILLTPYEEPENKILLVAQVQLWIQEAGAVDWKYVTSLKSIPADINEKMRFFPLGMSDAVGAFNTSSNLELDITVGRYKDYLQKMRTPPPPRRPSPDQGADGAAP